MKHKIVASSLLARQYLVVHDEGVKFCGTSLFRSVRKFRFDELLCLLLGRDHTLSFQVGEEVFTIRTQPNNAKHQEAIGALVERLEATKPSPAPTAAQPLEFPYPS